MRIRRGDAGDLAAIDAIQQQCDGLARWAAADYLAFDLSVAECGDGVTGFLVTREVGPGDYEILNVAVEPRRRRLNIARELISRALANRSGSWFLEVRESNYPARSLYHKLGFEEIGIRKSYYTSPGESAVVMRNRS